MRAPGRAGVRNRLRHAWQRGGGTRRRTRRRRFEVSGADGVGTATPGGAGAEGGSGACGGAGALGADGACGAWASSLGATAFGALGTSGAFADGISADGRLGAPASPPAPATALVSRRASVPPRASAELPPPPSPRSSRPADPLPPRRARSPDGTGPPPSARRADAGSTARVLPPRRSRRARPCRRRRRATHRRRLAGRGRPAQPGVLRGRAGPRRVSWRLLLAMYARVLTTSRG